MSMVDASVIPGNMKHAAVMGGDFAGIAVNLDEKGQAIPLPELWVPASMQEWGQVPDFVETIVSEDDDNGDSESFTRHMLTILPETGCGVDNLDVVKSVEKIERAASFLQSGVECLASIVDTKSKTADSKNQWRIETVFDCNSVTTPLHRIRLSVLVERVVANHLEEDGECRWRMVSSSKFSWPSIQIFWERRFAEASSSGTVADGGGLEGQRVGRWMGSVIQKQASSFVASTYPRLTENELRCQNSEEVLQLPGNLTLSINFGQNKTDKTGKALSLQMRHFEWDEERRIGWTLVPDVVTPTDALIAIDKKQ
ncbi:hypothetical protein ACA910_013492 [Epithemia clementina (nom. ined.)]